MTFQTFSPAAILQPYIEYYWVLHTSKKLENEILFPSGRMEFAINISDGGATMHFGNRVSVMPDIEILGHLTHPTIETIAANTTILITRFRPFAAALFLKTPAENFNNNSIDAHDVLGNRLGCLREEMLERATIRGKINVLENFLAQQLFRSNKNLKTPQLVNALCHAIIHDNQSFSLKKLAKDHKISERHIQIIFKEYVGISPRGLFSVQRFVRSLQLVRNSSLSLTDIGYECGYFDQAHFIREFKAYTGTTPLQVTKYTQKHW